MVLTSDRKFGVEIEFFCPSLQNLRTLSRTLNIVADGSLRHIPNSGEYVTPILQGERGERQLLRDCELLKKYNASGDDISMSVHVHHDGLFKDRQLIQQETRPENTDGWFGMSNRLLRKLPTTGVRALLTGGFVPSEISTSMFGGMRYYSLGSLVKEPTKHFTYISLDNDTRFKWLRNVLYFYTQYSVVMEDMVSNSRKSGNMYCIPLAKSYDLDVIESCKDMKELKGVWYKGSEGYDHYDNSRYHNVNLHSFWNRHGTVEIRSHGGTTDPYKILLWIKLHQKILDKLELLELNDIKPKTPNLHKEFIEFVEEPVLQSYVKRLVGFYSDIIIK